MDHSANKTDQKLCEICDTKISKYCCPRCEIFYCSLDCYKSEKHLDCSESFYKDWVNDELSSYHAGDEEKRKMLEILKKVQNDDEFQEEDLLEDIEEGVEEIDSDDDTAIDLHERLKDLNLEDADAIWDALNEDEKNEFEALIQGEVGTILPQWVPWWTFHVESKLVEEVQQTNSTTEHLKKCPLINAVPKLATLTNVKPSTAIKFNIANVLASYVFVMRYFNGEVEPVEAITNLLDICTNLNTNANFEEISTAIESVAQQCLQSDLIETDEMSLDVMRQDMLSILKGPSDDNKSYYCKAALSDLIDMFKKTKSILKASRDKDNKGPTQKKEKGAFSKKFPEHTKEHLPPVDETKIKKSIKKIEFYLSYIENCDINL